MKQNRNLYISSVMMKELDSVDKRIRDFIKDAEVQRNLSRLIDSELVTTSIRSTYHNEMRTKQNGPNHTSEKGAVDICFYNSDSQGNNQKGAIRVNLLNHKIIKRLMDLMSDFVIKYGVRVMLEKDHVHVDALGPAIGYLDQGAFVSADFNHYIGDGDNKKKKKRIKMVNMTSFAKGVPEAKRRSRTGYDYVVIHTTGADVLSAAINTFKDPGNIVGIHFIVDCDKDGLNRKVFQMCPIDRRVEHAGEGSISGLNGKSIGIEVSGAPFSYPFSKKQKAQIVITDQLEIGRAHV